MPILPSNTKCAQLGCKHTRSKMNSFCLRHGGMDTIDTEERKAFKSMYQQPMWKQLRNTQLSKQPLCQCCLNKGRVTAALHVDHVFPWNKIGKAYFYNNLFQSLCHECHSAKTALEQKGVFRYYLDPIRDYVLADANRVIEQQ